MVCVNPHEPLKGIPVSIRVPSHLEITVVETTYWEKKTEPGIRPTVQRLESCRPTRTVLPHVRETEMIFVVDPQRPAAGEQKYGFEFQSNDADADESKEGKGYLRNVKYKADDQTITQSAELLANSLSLVNAFQASVQKPNQNNSDLIATDRAIAFGRFDINSPTYECDVAAFLETHLNCSPPPTCPQPCKGDMCDPR